MITQIEHAETFRARTGGLTMGGLILAYCLQPLLEHANRTGLAFGGFLLAMAVVTFYQLDIWPALDQSARKKVAIPLAVLGSVILIWTFSYASTTAGDLDAQCRVHQQRMTYNDTAPVAGDKPATGHDAYAAMRCRWVTLDRPTARPANETKTIQNQSGKRSALPAPPVARQ